MTSNYAQYYPTSTPYGIHYSQPPADQGLHYHTVPLTRYGSSDGSTQASSPPTSPVSTMAYSPRSASYLQYDQAGLASSAEYYGSPDMSAEGDVAGPRRTSEDSHAGPSQSGRDHPVCCLHPGCNVKPFKRRADLDRHYKHRHAPDSQKESYRCDYSRCVRRHDPFHRRDHFRDHLREFHKEDIEKRGGVVSEEWFDGRYVPASWWRCPKCLVRIRIERHGYECPTCKTPCQVKRKEARRRD